MPGERCVILIVKCPCGEDHQVPVSLEKSITDWDEKITIVFGRRGSWRTTKGFLYFHGAEYDDFPELAVRYGFERVAEHVGDTLEVTRDWGSRS